MNNKGQFLLYDALFAIVIVSIVVLLSLHVFEEQKTVYDNSNGYTSPTDMLNLLDSAKQDNYSLLYLLTEAINTNNSKLKNQTLEKIIPIISSYNKYKYRLKDVSTNQTLLETSTDNKAIFSGRKIVNNHVLELDYCVK